MNDTAPSPASDVDALPLADSNLGVYLALHSALGQRRLPAPSGVRSNDAAFLALRKDIEQLLRHRPDQMADTGVLDQRRNQQVSRLTCSLAMLCCKSDLAAERQYCRQLMEALLSARGQAVRTRPDEPSGLGIDFTPDFLNLFRAAKEKFTDQGVCGLFQAMLGGKAVPLRTDEELLRLMTIVCDRCQAKEASQLLNGLLRAHDTNPAAFARLNEQRTIHTIINKFSEDDVVQVIRVVTIFIIRTSLKYQADELLQELVERLDSERLKLAATRLANVLARVRRVHPELISSLLRTLKSGSGLKPFLQLLGVLLPSPGTAREAISYDAQGLAAALYDAGLDPRVLAPFVQRIGNLDLSGPVYDRLTHDIGTLQRLLESGPDAQRAAGDRVQTEDSAARKLLRLLQLGLVRYEGDQLDYLAKAINVLSSDDFRRADVELIIGHAASDLPGSLDRLASPEEFAAEPTAPELGSALVTLWIQIELAGESKERGSSAADLSRRLRVVVDARGREDEAL